MQPARTPPDEAQRLEALRQTGVLDTAAEEAFDQLTALAAQICEAPIALISLVDEQRQWFKSRVGLATTETARDVAFCAHAILGKEMLVVPDATADQRFADNPLVASEPGIRFYAGSPLRTHDGHALGTLCVIDTVPRRLEPHQEEALRTLARHTAAQLELRRAMKLLRGELVAHLPGMQVPPSIQDSLRPLARALEHAIGERDQAEQAVRDLEARFRRVESFERIGRLAGGLAHDVNNLLTVVLGHSERLLGRGIPEPDQRASLEAVREAAALASQLLRRVLALGRQQPVVLEPLELDRAVRSTGDLLRLFVPERVEVVSELGADGARVAADPLQLEQVIVNLAINAADAMPSGGRLLLTTAVRELGEPQHCSLGTAAAGPHVVLSVADTGVGMDERTLASSMEPFFTTKPSGTGLGLSSVREILRSAGGALSISSRVGEGTQVDVYLPCLPRDRLSDARRVEGQRSATASGPVGSAQQDGVAVAPAGAARPFAHAPVAGAEVLLVVDDDDMVRELICRSLAEAGFGVLDARDGASALELASDHPGQLDLVISDVNLPGMSGGRLVRALGDLRPELAFLYVSGERGPLDDSLALQDADGHAIPFLPKPFAPKDLIRAVRSTLDRRRLRRR